MREYDGIIISHVSVETKTSLSQSIYMYYPVVLADLESFPIIECVIPPPFRSTIQPGGSEPALSPREGQSLSRVPELEPDATP